MKALRLRSDFSDFYDHAFAGSWRLEFPCWERSARTVATRKEDHDAMAYVGLRVTGARGDLGTLHREGAYDRDRLYVAYVDPSAHRGEGKVRGTVDDILRAGVPYGTYASAWHGPPCGGRSTRALAIGRWLFWLDYVQRDRGEWRSNVGDVDVRWGRELLPADVALAALLKLQRARRAPIVAVDFVGSEDGQVWAIDLNTSPGLRGTPIETDGLSAREVYDLCCARWAEIERAP